MKAVGTVWVTRDVIDCGALAVGWEAVLVFDRDRRKHRPTSEVKLNNFFNE